MPETLEQQLKTHRDASRARIPAAALATMDAATEEVTALNIAGTSIAVGDQVPQFTLPDALGSKVSLAAILAQGPAVITFYRGGWCPYCSLALQALQQILPEITARGATLVAISPQTPDSSLSTNDKLELAFPVLSDEGNDVAKSLGLLFTVPETLRQTYRGFGIDIPTSNGDDSFSLPVPATYVVGIDGRVVWRFVDPDYTKRAEPSDIVAALDSL